MQRNNSGISKAWTESELTILEVCYLANVSLKIMSRVLKKSESSISNALTRRGIRRRGERPRGGRSLEEPRAIDTIEEALKIIHDAQHGISPLRSLKEEHARAFYLKPYKTKRRQLGYPKGASRAQLERWTSLTHLMEYFAWRGVKLISIEDPHLLQQGFSYLLNGAPIKLIDLIKIINNERAALNLPRVFVEGITENNEVMK